jgi:ABC-2 type transport system ATP-binding protein
VKKQPLGPDARRRVGDDSLHEVASALGGSVRRPLVAGIWAPTGGRVRLNGVPAVIDIADLTVPRGDREVVRDVSVSVAAGSVTGLLGPSGCGKTTLMRAIVGVQLHAAGRVTVLGEPAGAASLRRRVGYVTQAPSVYGDLSIDENLRYFAAIVDAPAGRIDEILATVGLLDARGQLVASLSGGQRSRVSLATALLGRPELLVLDEPTTGLDPVLRAELWQSFRALAAAGTTLLVSSHQTDEAGECDALLLMRDGLILRATTPEALRAETGEDDLGSAFLAVIKAAGR